MAVRTPQMRIALLAPLVAPIAPPFLGGAQAMIYDLGAGLVRRGHEVALYAADRSRVPGVRLVPLDIDSTRLHPASFADVPPVRSESEDASDRHSAEESVHEARQAFLHTYRTINAHASEHDLVHAHAYDWEAFAFAAMQPLPTIHTLHLPPVDPNINTLLAAIAPGDTPAPPLASGAEPRLVTVSQDCATSYGPICR